MKRSLLGCVVAGRIAFGCVPSTSEEAPRGAVAITTTPTPATRGEAFDTTDGWRVRIETLDLLAWFYGTSDATAADGRSGTLDERLFRASQPLEVIVRAIPAGPAKAHTQVAIGLFLQPGTGRDPKVDGLDDESLARFHRPADSMIAPDCPPDLPCDAPTGPGVYIRARAEKAGRTIVLTASVQTFGGLAIAYPAVVVANQLTRVNATIAGEVLFTDDDGARVFDDIAIADLDRDGTVTGTELDKVASNALRISKRPARDAGRRDAGADAEAGADAGRDAGNDSDDDVSMLDVLRDRAERLFVP